jgi:hypothetical protein
LKSAFFNLNSSLKVSNCFYDDTLPGLFIFFFMGVIVIFIGNIANNAGYNFNGHGPGWTCGRFLIIRYDNST